MDKRGQATLFIILGIVLVVIIVLLFTTKTIELPRRSVESSQVSNIDAYVESCISKEVKDLLVGLRKQGGMTNPGGCYPDNCYYDDGRTKYYYIVENNGGQFAKHIGDEETMRDYLSGQVKNLLNNNGVCDPCKRFQDIQCGNFDVTTFSNNEKIMINVNSDKLIFTKGGSDVNVGEINLVINDDFFKGYGFVKKIADENMKVEWFNVYNYLSGQFTDLNVRIEGSPVANGDIRLFYVWVGDGTEEEAFYFAIKK